METLLKWDHDLFLAINGWHAPWADFFFYWISEKWVWIPVYAVVGFFFYKKHGWKGLLFLGALAGLCILLADQSASGLLKPWVGRLRPCHEPSLEGMIHAVKKHCGGQYGFASSHAANFFALAVYFGHSLNLKAWGKWILLLVAVLVAYSRVYLGVHYPGDVLMGAALGILSAKLVIALGKRAQGWLNLDGML